MTAPLLSETIPWGWDQIETTRLGLVAYEGDVQQVKNALPTIDWNTQGTHLLHACLYSGRSELALDVLRAGSPLDESTYTVAFRHCREVIRQLPPRPELIENLQRGERLSLFCEALQKGDLMSAKGFVNEGPIPINQRIFLNHQLQDVPPLHYAIRSGNADLIQLVLDHGAEVNALDASGKSPMRCILDNPLIEAEDLKNSLRLLRARGGRVIPSPKGWKERMRLWLLLHL